MKPKKPIFKTGDRIQCVGAPSETSIVTNVQENTDGRGNFYTLETPAGTARELPTEAVDQTHIKNARAFNRQYELLNKEPPQPGFDEDGFPTFEDDE